VSISWRGAQAKYQEELLAAPKDEDGKPKLRARAMPRRENCDVCQDEIRCPATRAASTSTLQRRAIAAGAARLIDLMEKDGSSGRPMHQAARSAQKTAIG